MGNVENLYKISQKFFLKIIFGHLSFTPVLPIMDVASFLLSLHAHFCHVSLPSILSSIAYTSRVTNMWISIPSAVPMEQSLCSAQNAFLIIHSSHGNCVE